MQIDDTFIAGFEEGRSNATALRELLTKGDLNDPQVAAEVTQLSESMQTTAMMALQVIHAALIDAKAHPIVRKTLEAMGLTREEVKRLADACLAIYEDKPETRA